MFLNEQRTELWNIFTYFFNNHFKIENKEDHPSKNHADMEVVVETGPVHGNETVDYDDDDNENEEEIVSASSLFAKNVDCKLLFFSCA